jgi:hypothetical protein
MFVCPSEKVIFKERSFSIPFIKVRRKQFSNICFHKVSPALNTPNGQYSISASMVEDPVFWFLSCFFKQLSMADQQLDME